MIHKPSLKRWHMNNCIVVDVDNVLADSIGRVLEIINERYKTKYIKDDIRSPKLVGSVKLAPQEIFSIQRESWKNWRQIKPLESNPSDLIRVLKEIGLEVVISTTSPNPIPMYINQWLQSYELGAFLFKPLRRQNSKYTLECQYLVDDTVEEIINFSSNERVAFLYNQPWNTNASIPEDLIRVSSLKQVKEHLLQLNKHRV